MKLLITENKFKDMLKLSIKDLGVQSAINTVGGWKNFCKVLKIESPMDFLHLFDDLEQVQSEENKYATLFRYKPNHNFMVYDRKNEEVLFNYIELWSFLEYKFGLKFSEINSLIKEWLDDVYNLRGVTIDYFRQLWR